MDLGAMGLDYGSMGIRIFLVALSSMLFASRVLNGVIRHPVDRVREAINKTNLASATEPGSMPDRNWLL